ncbi:MAG: hypothetical protein ACYC33_12530 [Thermoleophilia bacterium]
MAVRSDLLPRIYPQRLGNRRPLFPLSSARLPKPPPARWLCPDIVTYEFKEHAKAIGMGHLTFHQLRHGAASLLIAQGCP